MPFGRSTSSSAMKRTLSPRVSGYAGTERICSVRHRGDRGGAGAGSLLATKPIVVVRRSGCHRVDQSNRRELRVGHTSRRWLETGDDLDVPIGGFGPLVLTDEGHITQMGSEFGEIVEVPDD